MERVIETMAGPLSERDLEIREVREELVCGGVSITRNYFFAGYLVRSDVKVVVDAWPLACKGQ